MKSSELPEGVYPPREDSELLREELVKEELDGKKVLDMGTGSGFLARAADKKGAEVTAADINPEAVGHVEEGLDVEAVESDLFENVEGRFDIIVFNPPYVPGKEEFGTDEEKAWRGGEQGREVIDRFLGEVPKHLEERGVLLLLQSSRNDVDRTLKVLEGEGLEGEVVAQEKHPWEELVVIRAEG